MFRKRPPLIQLLPLLLAAVLLFGLPKIPLLVQFEHFAFPVPERFEKDAFFIEKNDPADFRLEVLRLTHDDSHSANIGAYLIDENTREIMGPDEGGAVEWAQFLRQTRLPDDRLIVITSSLSWQDTTELALRALQEQVDETPRLVVGLRAELLNRPSPLPPELADSVIPGEPPSGFNPPEVDHLSAPPSVTAPLFGISEVRGLKIEDHAGSVRIPLIVRWGKHLLPSLPLASLVTAHRLTPSDILFEPGGYLRLGRTGPILPIDSSGFTDLKGEATIFQSASKLQIYPGQAETIKIIVPEDSPRLARQLPSQLTDALGRIPEAEKTYRRWPFALEIILLLGFFLPFFSSRPWLVFPALPIVPVLSIFCSRWFLLTPLLLILLATLLSRTSKRNKPAPVEP